MKNEHELSGDLAWGVDAISRVINRTPSQTYYLLRTGSLPPARKVGGGWVASRNRLLAFLGAGGEASDG